VPLFNPFLFLGCVGLLGLFFSEEFSEDELNELLEGVGFSLHFRGVASNNTMNGRRVS
jgi:hypothetical protein